MSTDTDIAVATVAAEQALAERVASDLATLGELAKASPELADLVATTISQLCLVIAQHSPIGPGDVLAAASALGAGEPTVSVDGYFAARDVDLPAGVVRLSVIHLQPPAEQASDSLFED